MAGFRNPSGLNFIEQQPTPMFSEGGRGNEAAGPFTTAPQGEMASFFSQLPSEGGLIESNNVSQKYVSSSHLAKASRGGRSYRVTAGKVSVIHHFQGCTCS